MAEEIGEQAYFQTSSCPAFSNTYPSENDPAALEDIYISSVDGKKYNYYQKKNENTTQNR